MGNLTSDCYELARALVAERSNRRAVDPFRAHDSSWNWQPLPGISGGLDRPSAKLPIGDAFGGFADLKRVLVENHRDEFARNLTQELLTYATGPSVEDSVEPSIDAIVDALDGQGCVPLCCWSSKVNRSAGIPYKMCSHGRIRVRLETLLVAKLTLQGA